MKNAVNNKELDDFDAAFESLIKAEASAARNEHKFHQRR